VTTPLTAEQRDELRRLEKELPQFELDDSGEEPLVTLYVVGTSDFAKARSAAVAQSMVQMRNALPALLAAADRAEELEARVKVLEGLLVATAEGLVCIEEFVSNEWHCTALDAVQELSATLALELRSQPQPGDKRRDEQGETEQLVGPGDDPNDRDDR
jgi:hypothetical protein